jgi:hypothetical protein
MTSGLRTSSEFVISFCLQMSVSSAMDLDNLLPDGENDLIEDYVLPPEINRFVEPFHAPVELEITLKDFTLLTCPVCLGFIRDAMAVMECLHRFCRECINSSLRLGYNFLTRSNRECLPVDCLLYPIEIYALIPPLMSLFSSSVQVRSSNCR